MLTILYSPKNNFKQKNIEIFVLLNKKVQLWIKLLSLVIVKWLVIFIVKNLTSCIKYAHKISIELSTNKKKEYRCVNHSMTYIHVISNLVGPDFYVVTRTANYQTKTWKPYQRNTARNRRRVNHTQRKYIFKNSYTERNKCHLYCHLRLQQTMTICWIFTEVV